MLRLFSRQTPPASRSFGLRLTRAGGLYILLTLVLGFAAVNTGNNLLYLVVSALLGFMSLSGWLGRKNLQRLQVHWDPPEEIYAGTPAIARLQVINDKPRWPSFLLDLMAPTASGLIAALPAGQRADVFPQLHFRQRGTHPLPAVEIHSPFPVNFFVRRIGRATAQNCLVLPRPRPVKNLWPEDGQGQSSDLQPRRSISEGDFYSLQAYSGEPMRQIHWRQSARQQALQVKQLAASGPPPLQIDLQQLPGSSVEVRLGQACWLIQRCALQNRPVGLTLGQRRWPVATGAAHRRTLLRELARYEA